MTSPKCKKLLTTYTIIALVFAVLGICLFILSGEFTGLADDLRSHNNFYAPQSVLNEIALYEVLSLIFIIAGVMVILCGCVFLALYFRVYSKTYITIKSDGRVHGVAISGTKVFKTVSFSGNIANVEAPIMQKNVLGFALNGARYAIYTDEPTTYYNMLLNKVKKV